MEEVLEVVLQGVKLLGAWARIFGSDGDVRLSGPVSINCLFLRGILESVRGLLVLLDSGRGLEFSEDTPGIRYDCLRWFRSQGCLGLSFLILLVP